MAFGWGKPLRASPAREGLSPLPHPERPSHVVSPASGRSILKVLGRDVPFVLTSPKHRPTQLNATAHPPERHSLGPVSRERGTASRSASSEVTTTSSPPLHRMITGTTAREAWYSKSITLPIRDNLSCLRTARGPSVYLPRELAPEECRLNRWGGKHYRRYKKQSLAVPHMLGEELTGLAAGSKPTKKGKGG